MRLVGLPRAAILCCAVAVRVVAAQSGVPSVISISERRPVRRQAGFRSPQGDGDRATEIITGSDTDHRLALVVASNNIQLPPEELRGPRPILREPDRRDLRFRPPRSRKSPSAAGRRCHYQRVAESGRRRPRLSAPFALARLVRSVAEAPDSGRALLAAPPEPPYQSARDGRRRRVQVVLRRASRQTEAPVNIGSPKSSCRQRPRRPPWSRQCARIVAQIRAGANFQAYARQYSEASTAARGGDLGWVRAGQLPPELAAIVTQMPVGAISDPIPVQGGFSIIALADTRQILVADPRDALLSLMQLTIATPDMRNPGASRSARSAARCRHPGYGRLRPGQETAQQVGAELVGNDQVRVRELPPVLQGCCSFSASVRRRRLRVARGISVLVLCGRDDPRWQMPRTRLRSPSKWRKSGSTAARSANSRPQA